MSKTDKNKMPMATKIFILGIFLNLFALDGIALDTYSLKNQKIEVSVDRQGNLAVLKNLQTGINYASGKPLWRMYFDRKNEKDIMVLPGDNTPEIVQNDNSIVISYKKLKKGGENLAFSLSLQISLEENMVRFSSAITNSEPSAIVREIQYPLIGNCLVPPDFRLLTVQRGGHIYADPKEKIRSMNYSYRGPDHHFRQLNIAYPMGVSANCFALISNQQGLYFGSHDSTFQYTGHGVRLYPDEKGDFNQLELGFYKYPNCLPGETWSNHSNVIAPYNGSWHETSKLYRAWANTWWKHREEPEWVKRMPGFQRMIMRHQNGETLFSYEEFAGRIKKAGESAGINVAFPFGWWDSGMDNGYPDSYYTTDARQGGDKAWKQAVADYRKDGGKVIMYFNGKLIDTESPFYKNGNGKKVCYVNSTGVELSESYRFPGEGTFSDYFNPRSFVVADTRNPLWRQQLIKMADRAAELGADCVFYDQLGYAESATNWDLTKEFPVLRMNVIADKADALNMIHEYIDKKDKNMAIGTEWITDVTAQQVDFVHGIFGLGSATGSTHANFIDWFRYTFPEVIISDRDIDGDEPNVEWLANRAVMLGLRANVQTFRLRGLIDETPRYQEHLAKVNHVVKKYDTLLLAGTYRDTEGFQCNNPEIEARCFTNGEKMAVVMTHDSKTTLSSQLSVPGYRFKESSGVGDFQIKPNPNGEQDISIGKNSLIVLVFEKI